MTDLQVYLEGSDGRRLSEAATTRDMRTTFLKVEDVRPEEAITVVLQLPKSRANDLSIDFDIGGRCRGSRVFFRGVEYTDEERVKSTSATDWYTLALLLNHERSADGTGMTTPFIPSRCRAASSVERVGFPSALFELA